MLQTVDLALGVTDDIWSYGKSRMGVLEALRQQGQSQAAINFGDCVSSFNWRFRSVWR